MSPGGLNGSGLHPLPRLDEPRSRRRPWATKLLIALGTALISVAAAAAVARIKGKEGATEAIDQRLLLHDKEISELNTALQSQGNRILDIAYWMGVPPDARKMPNLGVQPMPAASRSHSKPREPQ